MIGAVLKPWSFVNNTETADANKVNQNFDLLFAAVNELIGALNTASGTKTSLAARLAVSLNDGGTIKGGSLPDGLFDARATRTIAADSVLLNGDSIILVDTTAGDIALSMLSAVDAAASPTVVNIGMTGFSVNMVPAAGETIMGLGVYSLTVAGESVRLSPDGISGWWRSG